MDQYCLFGSNCNTPVRARSKCTAGQWGGVFGRGVLCLVPVAALPWKAQNARCAPISDLPALWRGIMPCVERQYWALFRRASTPRAAARNGTTGFFLPPPGPSPRAAPCVRPIPPIMGDFRLATGALWFVSRGELVFVTSWHGPHASLLSGATRNACGGSWTLGGTHSLVCAFHWSRSSQLSSATLVQCW